MNILIILILLFAVPQEKIPSSKAKEHIGEIKTVCGFVASTRYLPNAKGQPTFLNVGKAYPNQDLTIVIWGINRSKFGEPEKTYNKKNVCATGKIENYKGTPQIVVAEKTQIKQE